MSFMLTDGRFKAFTDAGVPLVGGLLYTYVSGTTTNKATYTSALETTPNTNPVVLNARGEAQVWLGTGAYTFVLKTSAGTTVWTVDDVQREADAVATLEAKFLDQDHGANMIAYPLDVDAAPGTVAEKLGEYVSLFDYMTDEQVEDVKAYTFATDVTVAVQAALVSGKKLIRAPAGGYYFTAQLVIPAYVTLQGDGYGLFAGTGATRFKKHGDFNGIVLSGASQLRDMTIEGDTGNTLDGVHVLGGRSLVSGVSVFAMGRDGIKVGDYTASSANTNLWRITNCIVRSNGRHGCHVAHEGAAGVPNANAGIILGLEATSNTNDGLLLGDTVDNQVFGLCSQSNSGWGFRLSQYARGNYIALPYTEFNTAGDGGLEIGANRNFVLGFRGGQNNDGWVDNGSSNVMWGRYASVQDVPLHRSAEAFEDLRILEPTTSGVWEITKKATSRHLSVALNSSSTADVLVENTGGGAAGVRFGTGGNTGALRGILVRTGVTINFGSIATNSTGDQTVTLTGADDTYVYTISAVHALPAGITVDCYWDGAAVKARASNTTGSSVTVNGAFNIVAIKFSA